MASEKKSTEKPEPRVRTWHITLRPRTKLEYQQSVPGTVIIVRAKFMHVHNGVLLFNDSKLKLDGYGAPLAEASAAFTPGTWEHVVEVDE